MCLPGQSVGVLLSPSESCERGMRLMSIYETLMIIISAAKLIIEIVKLIKENKK